MDIDGGQSLAYIHAGNKKAVVLVHGLGGNNTETYWGRLIELMNYDDRLGRYDFYYWKYRTSRWLMFPPLARPSRQERNSTVPEVASALADDVRGVAAARGYTDVSLIGHSLGGLISLIAGGDLVADRGAPLRSVCAMATPLNMIFYAWMANAFFQDMNPHIHFLAQPSQIRKALRNVETINSAPAHTAYMYFIGDGFLHTYQQHPFAEVIEMQGAHSWMHAVNGRQHGNYGHLASYILRNC